MAGHRRVLIASGDRLFADCAATWLSLSAGYEVTTVTSNGVETLNALAHDPPDAVLMTDDLAQLNATALASQIARRWPLITTVVLSDSSRANAHVLSPTCSSGRMVEALSSPPRLVTGGAHTPSSAPVSQLQSLTRKELEIFRMLAGGLTAKEAAAHLGISTGTIRTHTQRIYSKLGLHTRLEVIRLGADVGISRTQSFSS